MSFPRGLALAVVLAVGCAPPARDDAPAVAAGGTVFRWSHLETTGLTDELEVNGVPVAVMFSSGSAPEAVASLRALSWGVSSRTRAGTRLLVVGRLDPVEKHTPSCNACATSEPYHDLALLDWHLELPFEETIAAGEEPPFPDSYVIPRTRLTLEDFPGHTGPIDVERHQAPAALPPRAR